MALANRQNPIPSEVNSLDELLDCARALLENIVFSWSGLLFEVETRPLFEAAAREIDFDSIRAALLEAEADFEAVGLTGNQLQLKLSGLSRALSRFVTMPSISRLWRVLDILVSILASLASKNEIFEQLKELFEMTERLKATGEDA